MLIYYPQIEDDLTKALQLSDQLQQEYSIPLVETLENRMIYLSLYANRDHIDNTITVLGVDFADYSFSFGVYFRGRLINPSVTLEDIRKNLMDILPPYMTMHEGLERYGYQMRINGGLIYHGPHKTRSNLTVTLSPTSGWSIHT